MACRNLLRMWKSSRSILLLQKSRFYNSITCASTSVTRIYMDRKPCALMSFSTKPSTVDPDKLRMIDFDNHLQKLKTELSTNGFVDINSFVSSVEKLSFNLTESESKFLLDCYLAIFPSETLTKRFEAFTMLWDAIKKNASPTKEHYLKAALIFKQEQKSANEFEKLLIGCSFKNDLEIQEALISILAEQGDVKRIQDMITEIRNSGNLRLSESIFNSLILANSKIGNLKECKNALDTMNAANILPTSTTFTEFICAFIENNQQDEAEKLLMQYSSTLSLENHLKIIRQAALKKMISLIEKCLKSESQSFANVKEVPLVLRKICIRLIYEGYPDEAFLIVNSIPKPRFNENQDQDTFAVFLILEFIKSNQPVTKTIQICQELIKNEKNLRALHVACEFALRRQQYSDDISELFKALSNLEPLRPHYFWPIILQKFRLDGEIGILNTIKMMKDFNVDCNHDTISNYILPKLSITLSDELQAIKILEKYGLSTSQLMTPLISHLLYQQKFDGICEIVEKYQTKLNTEFLSLPLSQIAGIIKITKNENKLIKMLELFKMKAQNQNYDLIGQFLTDILSNPKYKNDFRAIENLINEFYEKNFKISRFAADLLNRFLKNDTLKVKLFKMVDDTLKLPALESQTIILHPRDMSLEELECHLVELEAKNLNTRGVLRRLLQMCVREGKLERALELKLKCDKLRVQVSPGMMASIFDMYIKLKMLPDAEKYFNEIKKTFPGFLLDEHKIIDFAALLVENNRLEDAKKILKNRLTSSKVIGGEYIQKNIWQLLTNVANLTPKSLTNSSNANKTKEMFELLHKLGYCTPQNTLLGPIIREYLLRGEIKAAVEEYKNFATNYKKTPLQFELMSLLVGLSNGNYTDQYDISADEAKELLQTIVSSSSTVHGATNTNVCLALAIAESGTEGQLRKMLIDPNFRFNENMIMKNCEHLSNTGKIYSLLKLAKASRGLNHIIKEQLLYDILLNNFVKENDCESALKLYDKLCCDDELKISQNFIKNLTNLLKMNNYEIPSMLALRAQVL